MSQIQDIAKRFVDRCGEDEKTRDFSNKVRNCISQLEDDTELGEIILKLLDRFEYYSRSRINELFKEFHRINKEENKIVEEKTIYSIIEDDEKINSSSTFLEEYRLINNISSDFGFRLGDITISDTKHIENIVFIDDIIGSGKTVIDFFSKNIKVLQNVNVIIMCVVIMNEASSKLQIYFDENDIKSIIISASECARAFEGGYIFNDDECSDKMEQLRKFEKQLWKSTSNYILGYKNCQALVSFFRNTPNNTLSTFWYESDKWKPLFPRNKTKPLFIIERKRLKYNLSKRRTDK